MASTEVDVVVIGMGPGGEEVAGRLAEAGLSVVAVERELVGGECPYWGCVPSKMMIRGSTLVAETRRADPYAGRSSIEPDLAFVAKRIRDEATDDWDDQVAADRFTGKGGTLVRGSARLDGPGRVVVGDDTYVASRGVVVATGSAPVVPPVEGLSDTRFWTNREAISAEQAPASLIVLGGGAIGVELAQMFARYGSAVTVVEALDGLLPPEEPEAGEVVATALGEDGVTVRTGAKAVHVSRDGGSDEVVVRLEDGTAVRAAELLVSVGRRARVGEIGLDTLGLDPGARALEVDERMRAGERLWAVGDVTGVGAFTHMAMYQAAIAIRDILGQDGPVADYTGLARVTFTDPEVGSVGLTERAAREQGRQVRVGVSQVSSSARGWIHGPGNAGFTKLVADDDAGVLVGATSVGPWGGEVLSMLTLAVHARVPLDTLRTMIYAYPTFHRGVQDALNDLGLTAGVVGTAGQDGRVLLADLAAASHVVAATSRRTEKVAAVAQALKAADPDEVAVVVAYLSGELRQRRTGVGWASLRDLPAPAAEPTLGVSEVDAALERVAGLSGAGSQAARADQVGSLFGRATEPEQHLLRGLLTGELRQGALEGVMLAAVAQAAVVPLAEVRRAAMLRGAVGPVAEAALGEGAAGLAAFRLQVGRPVQPMLASTAADVPDALGRLGEAAVEWKLDGVRVQVHRSGSDVSVWTRSLDDITDRVPEVVEAALSLPVRELVLDGEAIALRPDGRPRPFQETGSRVSSRADVAAARVSAPLSTYLFDVLHADGEDVLDRPATDRSAALEAAVPEGLRVPRVVTGDADVAAGVLAEAVARGHEGVVVKSLDAPYEAGRRGVGWLKVKPRHTLDLVVLAAEWGHGRRRGWLSNLHLGARDPAGGFVMLGKTFKGLTDAMLTWQTERLQELAVTSTDWVVQVRPELVVEVAFDGVQTSPRYPAGMALRFARVLRHRPDKRPEEADTIDAVALIHRA